MSIVPRARARAARVAGALAISLLFSLSGASQGAAQSPSPQTGPKASPPGAPAGGKTLVVLTTSLGEITLELDADKAPITTQNFLSYVDSGHFDGTVFHRVIPDFMIQGGGFTADMKQKPTKAPIQNEAKNGLKNARGTIAMARTNDPNSATAQFFINLKDNDFLDARPGNPGYAVFGKVASGMDVVDKIAKVRTGSRGGHEDVPIEAVTIVSAKRK
jgi:cyclophilin family peptidyl-prolyl cis-trans isomerase